ncbi:MAG: hypothetical protein AABZ55_08865 [Bdellovibrionota bacterium]
MIRTSYMASHEKVDLDYVLETLSRLGKEFGIIGEEGRQAELAALAQAHFGVKAGNANVSIQAG